MLLKNAFYCSKKKKIRKLTFLINNTIYIELCKIGRDIISRIINTWKYRYEKCSCVILVIFNKFFF